EAIADAVVPVLAATRDVETLNAIYRRYDAVTPEDVRAVANRYFVDEGLVVTTLAHGDLPEEAMRASSIASALAIVEQELLINTIPGGQEPASEAVEVPRRESRPSTMTPQFREHLMRSSSPLINVRFLFQTGPADDPEGKEGLAELTARMIADAGSEAL